MHWQTSAQVHVFELVRVNVFVFACDFGWVSVIAWMFVILSPFVVNIERDRFV